VDKGRSASEKTSCTEELNSKKGRVSTPPQPAKKRVTASAAMAGVVAEQGNITFTVISGGDMEGGNGCSPKQRGSLGMDKLKGLLLLLLLFAPQFKMLWALVSRAPETEFSKKPMSDWARDAVPAPPEAEAVKFKKTETLVVAIPGVAGFNSPEAHPHAPLSLTTSRSQNTRDCHWEAGFSLALLSSGETYWSPMPPDANGVLRRVFIPPMGPRTRSEVVFIASTLT